MCSKRHQLSFLQRCSASVAQRFFMGCARLQVRAPFWPSGLTLRSSGLAFSQPLTLAVSTTENQFISPMFIQTAFNFSSVVQRLVCRFSGLRLLALRWFLVFLASGPCAASASSYRFRSAAPPRWRRAFSQLVPVAKSKLSVLASGSNISVKPTRILRSAYLARYASQNQISASRTGRRRVN